MVKSIYFLKPAWCGIHSAGLWPEQGLQPVIRATAFRRWFSLCRSAPPSRRCARNEPHAVATTAPAGRTRPDSPPALTHLSETNNCTPFSSRRNRVHLALSSLAPSLTARISRYSLCATPMAASTETFFTSPPGEPLSHRPSRKTYGNSPTSRPRALLVELAVDLLVQVADRAGADSRAPQRLRDVLHAPYTYAGKHI